MPKYLVNQGFSELLKKNNRYLRNVNKIHYSPYYLRHYNLGFNLVKMKHVKNIPLQIIESFFCDQTFLYKKVIKTKFYQVIEVMARILLQMRLV